MIILGQWVCSQVKVSSRWASRNRPFVKLKVRDIYLNFWCFKRGTMTLRPCKQSLCTSSTARTCRWEVFPFLFHVFQTLCHVIRSFQPRTINYSILFINNDGRHICNCGERWCELTRFLGLECFKRCNRLLPRGCLGIKSFIILSNFFLMRLSFSGVLSGESFGCMQRCYMNQIQKMLWRGSNLMQNSKLFHIF